MVSVIWNQFCIEKSEARLYIVLKFGSYILGKLHHIYKSILCPYTVQKRDNSNCRIII